MSTDARDNPTLNQSPRPDHLQFLGLRVEHWMKEDLVRISDILGHSGTRSDKKSDILRRISSLYHRRLRSEQDQETIHRIQRLARQAKQLKRAKWRKASTADKEILQYHQFLKNTECQICGAKLSPSNCLSRTKITQQCAHYAEICRLCLRIHINSQLNTNGWENVLCPQGGCQALMDFQAIQFHADAVTAERCRIKDQKSFTVGSIKYHDCAHRDCNSGNFADAKLDSYLVCAECDRKTCISCNCVWHTDVTCEEHRKKLAEEDEAKRRLEKEREQQEEISIAKVRKISKQCPNTACGWSIEKNHGCDHMTCKTTPSEISTSLDWADQF